MTTLPEVPLALPPHSRRLAMLARWWKRLPSWKRVAAIITVIAL